MLKASKVNVAASKGGSRRFRWTEHEAGVAVLSFDTSSSLAKRTRAKGIPSRQRQQALTPTQLKVAALAVRGRSNAEIAKELGIALRTVANHMAAILARMGVTSRFELAGKLTE